MPPVHPAIVHYPIALVTLSVVADLFGFIFGSQSLQHAGWWALLGAAIGAAVALVAGLFDMHREKLQPAAHHRVHTHMKVGLTLFALLAVLTIWRWSIYAGVSARAGRLYLSCAVLVLVLTFFQAWLGGELVFTEGVGVAPTGQGTELARPNGHLPEKHDQPEHAHAEHQ